MAMNGMDPQQFLQLLFSPQLQPQQQMQLAQQLASTAPPPALPQPPGMDFMLTGQQASAPQPALLPGTMMQQAPAPVVDQSMGYMPGESGGMPDVMQKLAALNPQQMSAFQSLLGGDQKPLPVAAPPAGRNVPAMAQIPTPQAFGPVPSLAMLLNGRR